MRAAALTVAGELKGQVEGRARENVVLARRLSTTCNSFSLALIV